VTTFIDTNILIYLLDKSSPNHDWSQKEFGHRKLAGPIILNDLVYSEFSAGMKSKADVDSAITLLGLERSKMSDDALYDAGQLFRKYKESGGPKNNVLADFFIAAHARSEGAPLLTGNNRDFRNLFPDLVLITPQVADEDSHST
jgi:predicted nucleic acid-binding protein